MRVLLFLIVLTATLGGVQTGFALPRFALMTGTRCASCHVNPTGGQMRNEYGLSFSQDRLPLEGLKDSSFAFSNKLNDNISIGADYRGQFIYDMSTSSDLTTDPLGQTTTGKSSFHSMTASIYASVRLSKKITFSLRQDLINVTFHDLGGPEVFVLARVLPGNWYIKGGDFLPEYGWRLDDHTAFTRGGNIGTISGLPPNAGLIFRPNYKDVGVELGGNLGSLSVTAGLFNGNGNTGPVGFSTEKAYVGKIEQVGSLSSLNYRVGISGYGYKSFKMAGITAGFGTEEVVLMGEFDLTHHAINVTASNVPVDEGVNQMAAYAELDLRALQGIWVTGKFDIFDPQQGIADDDVSPSTNSVKRVTMGLEIFPYSFIEIRPQYRLNIETPGVSNDQILVQTHVWY
jgi:hypothetical protein